MFNLIVRSGEWADGRDTLASERIFESTDRRIARRYRTDEDEPNFALLSTLPCLFMVEGTGDQLARVGMLRRGRVRGGVATLEYEFDRRIAPIRNRDIDVNRADFGIDDRFEFSRNHWAIKDEDLYRTIARLNSRPRQRPVVFPLAETEAVDANLVSVMMPFSAAFDRTYRALRRAIEDAGFECLRADEIWEQPQIITDVVSLIDRSRAVICDCSGRNPNVFYEMGIAHTLGREVIPITQNEQDIPFDIRHLRFVPYLPNTEGRRRLSDAIRQRLAVLGGR